VERESCTQRVHIQQYLADKHPDVDAVFRLSQPYGEIQFNQRKPVILNRGTFCPFNSQNTVTFEAAFPLLYLPSYVSFRMTDIWRSFISQAIIWSQGSFVSFHSSTVFQERNVHDLLHDFELEIPGYLENQRIVDILSSIHFSGSVGDRLYQAYDRLRKEDIIQEEELKLVENWLKDLEEC
jgi:hypothetical protein